jgi:uncharacterized protein YjbI with pentapeptide repeats
LSGANPRDADLGSAHLIDVNLSSADLNGANLSDVVEGSQEQLAQAKSLHDATMPDGQKYEDGLKSEGGGEDKETSGSS